MGKLFALLLFLNCVKVMSKSVPRSFQDTQRHQNTLLEKIQFPADDKFIFPEINQHDNMLTTNKAVAKVNIYSLTRPEIVYASPKSSLATNRNHELTSSKGDLLLNNFIGSLYQGEIPHTFSDSNVYSYQATSDLTNGKSLSPSRTENPYGLTKSPLTDSSFLTIHSDPSNIKTEDLDRPQPSILVTKLSASPAVLIDETVTSPHLTSLITETTSSWTLQHLSVSVPATQSENDAYQQQYGNSKYERNLQNGVFLKRQQADSEQMLQTSFKTNRNDNSELLLPSIIYSSPTSASMTLLSSTTNSRRSINNAPLEALEISSSESAWIDSMQAAHDFWSTEITQTSHIDVDSTSALASNLSPSFDSQFQLKVEHMFTKRTQNDKSGNFLDVSTTVSEFTFQDENSGIYMHSNDILHLSTQISYPSLFTLREESVSSSKIAIMSSTKPSLPETVAHESTAMPAMTTQAGTTTVKTEKMSWQLFALCRYLCKQRSIPVPPTCGCTISPWDRK